MARRRPVVVEEAPEPEIPERLRQCVVEDWLGPTETPPWIDREINGVPTGVEEVAWKLMLLARRRHKEAVAEWVAQGGSHPGHGRPVFRDKAAFLARIPTPAVTSVLAATTGNRTPRRRLNAVVIPSLDKTSSRAEARFWAAP